VIFYLIARVQTEFGTKMPHRGFNEFTLGDLPSYHRHYHPLVEVAIANKIDIAESMKVLPFATTEARSQFRLLKYSQSEFLPASPML